MSFLDHWQFTGFSTGVTPLYAVLMLSKGPIWTRAALSQGTLCTVLRHIGSCRTFVTNQLFVGGTVEVAVLARREADGILLGGQLQLTISGAKEHEQLEDRQEVLVNNSIRPEPSLPAIACRMTTEVP